MSSLRKSGSSFVLKLMLLLTVSVLLTSCSSTTDKIRFDKNKSEFRVYPLDIKPAILEEVGSE